MRISSVEMWNNNLYLILFFVNVVYAQNSDLLSILNGLPNTNLPINLTIDDFFFIGNGIFSSMIASNPCWHHLSLLYQGVENSEQWALQMIDASAKPQSGILYGNIMHTGNYEQCIEIDSEKIQGKYCTALFQPHPKYGNNLDFTHTTFVVEEANKLLAFRASYGICIPTSCTTQDLQQLVNIIEDLFMLPLHFTFEEAVCVANDSNRAFTTPAKIALVVFGLFGLITICSTLYDLLIHKDQNLTICTAFSMITNGKKLLATGSNVGSLGCLNGLRVISLMWIVLGHEFTYLGFAPNINSNKMLDVATNIKNAVLVGTETSVDTFFFISGFLVAYNYIKAVDNRKPVSIFLMYFHRIFRLTPSLAMVVLFYSTLVTYLATGPFWFVTEINLQKPCEDYWWSTLLYVQNYVNDPDHVCVAHSWYLAVDTQMYFLSPFIMYCLVKWSKKTVVVLTIYIILIVGYVAEVSWKNHLGSTFANETSEFMKLIYLPTHVRGHVYVEGLIAGYYIYYGLKKKLNISKFLATALWMFSLTIMLTIIFSFTHLVTGNDFSQPPSLDSALFNAFTKPLWSLSLFIIIYLCAHGYGSYINTFLSHSIFTLLIRLNYNVYLIHLIVCQLLLDDQRVPGYYSVLEGYHLFWGYYILSLGAATLWTLVFESPFINLEKLWFTPKKKPVLDRTN